MPKWKSVKSKSRKKSKKRFPRPFKQTEIIRSGIGFPKKFKMTLKYVDGLNRTAALGTLDSYYFSCNGLYDPNTSGTGHQPLYFDQAMQIYNHYTVIGSRIRCRFSPTAANETPFVCGILVNDDTSIPSGSTIYSLQEQTQVRTKSVVPNPKSPIVITAAWSLKKSFGKNISINDNLFRGNIATNPTEQMYYTLFLQGTDGSSSISYTVDVEIQFIAVFSEIIDLAQS